MGTHICVRMCSKGENVNITRSVLPMCVLICQNVQAMLARFSAALCIYLCSYGACVLQALQAARCMGPVQPRWQGQACLGRPTHLAPSHTGQAWA